MQVSTLQSLGLIKYWRGKHMIVTPTDLGEWAVRIQKKADDPNYPTLDPLKLQWDGFEDDDEMWLPGH